MPIARARRPAMVVRTPSSGAAFGLWMSRSQAVGIPIASMRAVKARSARWRSVIGRVSASEGGRDADRHAARYRCRREAEAPHEGALRPGVGLGVPRRVVRPRLQVPTAEGQLGRLRAQQPPYARRDRPRDRELAQLRPRPILDVLLEDAAPRLEVAARNLVQQLGLVRLPGAERRRLEQAPVEVEDVAPANAVELHAERPGAPETELIDERPVRVGVGVADD